MVARTPRSIRAWAARESLVRRAFASAESEACAWETHAHASSGRARLALVLRSFGARFARGPASFPRTSGFAGPHHMLRAAPHRPPHSPMVPGFAYQRAERNST